MCWPAVPLPGRQGTPPLEEPRETEQQVLARDAPGNVAPRHTMRVGVPPTGQAPSVDPHCPAIGPGDGPDDPVVPSPRGTRHTERKSRRSGRGAIGPTPGAQRQRCLPAVRQAPVSPGGTGRRPWVASEGLTELFFGGGSIRSRQRAAGLLDPGLQNLVLLPFRSLEGKPP